MDILDVKEALELVRPDLALLNLTLTVIDRMPYLRCSFERIDPKFKGGITHGENILGRHILLHRMN